MSQCLNAHLCPHFRSLSSTSPLLLEAVQALLTAKVAAGRRTRTIANLRQSLAVFARGREFKRVGEISVADVEEWVGASQSDWGRQTRANQLSSLFSFSVRRGWVRENPVKLLERVTIEHRPPAILLAPACAALLAHCGPDLRPWVVLGLFAGLRPDEAERLDWSSVRLDIECPTLTVDASTSKVRRRRIVPLLPAAVRWLAMDAREKGPVVSSHSTMRRRRREACERAGITWTQDVGRHTHASMRLAMGHHAADVASDMGNSPRILLTHYRELVRREDAERFWSLRPEPVPTPASS